VPNAPGPNHDNFPGILFYVGIEADGDFRFVSMSDAGLVAMGMTRDQVVGALVRDVIPPPSRELVLNHYRDAIHSGQTVHWREVSEYPAGRRVAEVAVTPLYDERGVARQLVGLVHDITEREQLESALREREERLRVVLKASGAGSWTRDIRAEHLDWDQGFRRLYGFTPDEPASFDAWRERVHEDDRARVLELIDDVQRQTRSAWDVVFRIVRPDKTIAWIQSLGRVECDGSADIRLAGLELDITAQRRAEDADRARRDEAHNRELRALLETATQGIASVDAQGSIITANRAMEEMFGWGAGELPGQSLEQLVPPARRDAHVQHRAGYFATPHSRLMGSGRDALELELLGLRKDGTTFPVEVSLNHIPTAEGGRAIAFVTDITERRRAEAERQQRSVELQLLTDQLRQMASDLTLAEQHAREQLARTLHDGVQQLMALAALKLEQAATHPQTGATELIDQARADLGEAISAARSLSFELSPPFLHGLGLPDGLTWLAHWIQSKYGLHVHLSSNAHADSPDKEMRTLLFESVRELLVNAAKHARVDQVSVDLGLGPGDTLCISVADEGVGFDPAVLAERTKAGQLGWGLFSIRERLALLGGQLEIESAPQLGTRFRLIAPRTAASALRDAVRGPQTVSRLARAGEGGDPSTGALKILLVDDHDAMRHGLRDLLQHRPGLRVVGEAANGRDAIAQARTLRPDVVIMDVIMPDMDGVEATRRLHNELPDMLILGVSTQPRVTDRHPIEHAGAAGFYTKGVDNTRLIDHLLAVQRQTQRTAESSGV
jgi:PAS domain S-box-containing protein